MIDNHAKTMALLRQMEEQLPIPARPTAAFIRAVKALGITIAPGLELSIKKVLYGGDAGGIMCDVTPPHLRAQPIICSITQIEINPEHPLAGEIRAYQAERMRRVARAGGPREVTSFTLERRAKRRR